MKKMLITWLFGKEYLALCQAIWDLRICITLMRKYGINVEIMEMDLPERRFYNPIEKKNVGSRVIVGFKHEGKNNVFDKSMGLTALSADEIVKKWERFDVADNDRITSQSIS